MDDERLRKTVQLLDGFAPDGSAAKNVLLSQPVVTMWISFSNLCLYLNCAIERGFLAGAKKDCGWVTTTTTTTVASTTTAQPPPCQNEQSGDHPIGLSTCAGLRATDIQDSVSCMRGQCPSFYWGKANNSDPETAKYGMVVNCPDPSKACVLLTDGTTCSGGDIPPDTLEFYPFCDAGGNCNMYLVQGGDYHSGLTCADGSWKEIIEQIGGDFNNPTYHFDQYDYLKVIAVCCDGCDAILPESNQCTYPATKPTSPIPTTTTTTTPTTTTSAPPPLVCPYTAKSTQANLVLLPEEARTYSAPSRPNTEQSIGSCPCSVGRKFFWNSGSSPDPNAAASAVAARDITCPDLCIIDEAGTECTLSRPFKYLTVNIMPFCAKEKCHMYVRLFNTAGNPLTCGSKNFTYDAQETGDGGWQHLDPDASPQAYAHAAAFSCKGCAAIRGSNCTLPPPTTTTMTTPTPGANCDNVESLVQADAANNSVLTSGINAAWNSWSRSDKANFAAYKKRIENAVYNRSSSGAEKISVVSNTLDGYAPDGSSAKDLILAITVGNWGSLCDFLNCAIRGGHLAGAEKNCEAFTTTMTSTTSTSTTSMSTTSTTMGTTTTSPDEVAYYCPAGWTYFAYTKSCYMLNRDAPASSFEEQGKACQAMGAHLISIHRNSEQTLILAILVEKFVTSAWIGLHSPTSNLTYVWTDGTAYDYRHWADGFPNATAPNHCVRVTTTDQVKLAPWLNADCAQNLPGICKKAAIPVGQGSCPPACEPGWTGFSDGSASRYCAKYVSTNVTYDEALAKCQELGATLPTVRSEKENDFFLKLATASASDPVWLGLRQDMDTFAWSWQDGSALDGFTHWASGHPESLEPPATCVNLFPSVDGETTGLWKNGYCNCDNCHWAAAICVKSSAA